MNYFIYTYIISLLTGTYELNKLTSLPMCGFIAQLVEHRTGIAEVTGSNPVEALIFFRLLLSSCLNWKIHCDDHSSLSSITAVRIYELFHIYLHQCSKLTIIVYSKRRTCCEFVNLFLNIIYFSFCSTFLLHGTKRFEYGTLTKKVSFYLF